MIIKAHRMKYKMVFFGFIFYTFQVYDSKNNYNEQNKRLKERWELDIGNKLVDLVIWDWEFGYCYIYCYQYPNSSWGACKMHLKNFKNEPYSL